jgi:hypothetical protein
MNTRRVQKLEALIDHLEVQLEVRRGVHVIDVDYYSGEQDLTKFERTYGCTPDKLPPSLPLIERVRFNVSPERQELAEIQQRHRELTQTQTELAAAQRRLHATDVATAAALASGGVSQRSQPIDVASINK